MASPQIENGYTTIANEILDHLYKQPLNGTELKVVMCILRYTFGFRRKSHKLSASFMNSSFCPARIAEAAKMETKGHFLLAWLPDSLNVSDPPVLFREI